MLNFSNHTNPTNLSGVTSLGIYGELRCGYVKINYKFVPHFRQ